MSSSATITLNLLILHMKKETHPTYFPQAKVACACGNSFTTGSTVKDLHVEICSACHPFYTGKEKVLDTAGRVERFRRRQTKKQDMTKKKLGSKAKAA